MSKSKRIALCGVLTALALALSLAERMIPLELLIPVPGIKLGLIASGDSFISTPAQLAAVLAVRPEAIMDAVVAGVQILEEKRAALKAGKKNRSAADAATGAHASCANVPDTPGAGSAGVE